ncbi:hypothetical protein K227x_37720 [Rubripirellula lacrimiformis]|uniref:NMT1/THI5 like protein n=2 Tax=Rubripirellula lacrimiformis TaxID=1930273 RepID=A0A517NE24_9BACT|nr:hypothetical protein K227x_37720 [Rubripirellula lacrimiformis]
MAVGLLLMLGIGGWLYSNPSTTTVVISTGSEGGVYHKVGTLIGDALHQRIPEVHCTIDPSVGSTENIARLEAGTTDVAIVQNDAVASQRVRSLAMLYTESLHLVCRREAQITCLNDLVSHQTNLGSTSGGTSQLVNELLSFAQIQLPESMQTRVGFTEAETMLVSGQLDAAFFLVGVGSDIIQRLLADPRFELVPIQLRASGASDSFFADKAFIDGFQTRYPYATYREIPLMAYQGKPTRPVASIGIGAVLVCRDDWDQELARVLVQAVFAHKAVLGRKISLLTNIDETTSQSSLQFPLHLGADAYYRRNEPGYLAENAESIGLLITLALLTASGLHGAKKWIDQNRKNRVDVYYARVQETDTLTRQATTPDDLAKCEERLRLIEAQACDELIAERLDADHSYVILQNMLIRCHTDLDRKRPPPWQQTEPKA